MRLDLPYPVLYRNNTGPVRGNTFTLAWDVGAFEVEEKSEGDLPVLARFRRQHGKSDDVVCLDRASGGIVSPSMTVRSLSSELEGIAADGRVSMKYSDLLKGLVAALAFRADGLIAQGAFVDRQYERNTRFMAPFRQANPEDLAEGKRDFEAVLDGWVICRGRLNVASEEPLFQVYRTNDGWKTALIPAPYRNGGRVGVRYHFSLDRFEEMETFKRYLCEVTGAAKTEDVFSLSDGFETTRDCYALDVELAALDFVGRIADALKEHHRVIDMRERKHLIEELPTSMLKAYVAAREFLEMPVEERTEEMNTAMIHEIAAVSETCPKGFRVVVEKPVVMATYLEKWNARPIGFSMEPDFGRLRL